MIESENFRDVASVVVPRTGRLVDTGEAVEPYRLIDADGMVVNAVSIFFRELLAAGKAPATVRSYGMDLLRWWRFLGAIDVAWDRATRVEARDFSSWIQVTTKMRRGEVVYQASALATAADKPPNAVTGKPRIGSSYANSTVAHSETVLRTFYEFHRDEGSGPIINPFPLDVARKRGRRNAHRNPMDEWSRERSGRYRPNVATRIPRAIPDDYVDTLFAALPSNRDRALVAFWISSGVRASELLGLRNCDVDPGQQSITVVRKGTRAIEQVPASGDAFVWLRLYQEDLSAEIDRGRLQPLWWTLRRPWQPLKYHAAHRMFERANATLGANWTLHDLRHSAAMRMTRDPQMRITDVKEILGHAHLSTTQIYLVPTREEVMAAALNHHARNAEQRERPPVPPAPGYDPDSLSVLFRRPI